ncbi:MAG: hypothetical protein AB2689_04275 [Candidatus Thiodiazotropha taylori]
MKVCVFRSDKGDCLLIQGDDGTSILADGGMATSYRRHVAEHLPTLAGDTGLLDLVYVSHIDEDHIAGILAMMDDVVDWQVYDYQRSKGNQTIRPPRMPRPLEVKQVWHNAFSEMMSKNTGAIRDQLATNASLLVYSDTDWAVGAARIQQELIYSERQAELLNRRLDAKQLDIPQNPQVDGKLLSLENPGQPIDLGGLQVTIVGPTEKDLEDLRKRWKKWLRSQKGRQQLAKIKRQAERDQRRLHASELDNLTAVLLAQSSALGDRDSLTTPNLASLMLLIKEGDKSVLMTGDGHADDILNGLAIAGELDDDEMRHVNVLKVPHHGATANMTKDFAKRVIADHYVFCGNGAHGNPEPDVIDVILESRLGKSNERSRHSLAGRPFKLWFNEHDENEEAKYPSSIKRVRRKVERVKQNVSSRMRSPYFLKRDYFKISL